MKLPIDMCKGIKMLLIFGYVDEVVVDDYGSRHFWFMMMIQVLNMYFNVYKDVIVMWL
jgi:hypothetical protein